MGALDIAKRALDQFGFFSKALEEAKGAPMKKGTAQQWSNVLTKKGVKQAELEATGFNDLFKQDPNRVMSQDEVVKFLTDNRVKLAEAKAGGPEWNDMQRKIDALQEEIDNAAYNGNGRQVNVLKNEMYDLQRQADRMMPQYEEWRMPGGSNYGENRVYLPNPRTPTSVATGNNGAPAYVSSHWQEPNVVFHTRQADRVGPNGERVLHLDELQSDWGQAGRDQGFVDLGPYHQQKKVWDEWENQRDRAIGELEVLQQRHEDDVLQRFGISRDEWRDLNDPGGLRKVPRDLYEAMMTPSPELQEAYGRWNAMRSTEPPRPAFPGHGIEPGPFVTETNDWVDLALKKALIDAERGGYDAIAWTPGKTQADRYSLAHHIGELRYYPELEQLDAFNKNGLLLQGQPLGHVPPDKLPSVIGKDAADRLLKAPLSDLDGTQGHHLTNLDLQFGGEGMNTFYDKIVVDRANKLARTLDPRRNADAVEPFSMPVEDARLHTLRLTPEMKDQIRQGLPLFVGAPAVAGGALSALQQPQEPPQDFDKGGAVKSAAGALARAFTRSASEPEKTVQAYKLFRQKGDDLFPLFVDADVPVPQGEWLDAQSGQLNSEGKVRSQIGPLAYRPGWHAGDLPIATHIGGRYPTTNKTVNYRRDNEVWAEIQMPDDVDWQTEANLRGTNKKGRVVPVRAHITDQVPVGGHYRYKTNPNMTGNWLIGGSMKVNRVLPYDEVKAINEASGVSDLPSLEELQRFLESRGVRRFESGGYADRGYEGDSYGGQAGGGFGGGEQFGPSLSDFYGGNAGGGSGGGEPYGPSLSDFYGSSPDISGGSFDNFDTSQGGGTSTSGGGTSGSDPGSDGLGWDGWTGDGGIGNVADVPGIGTDNPYSGVMFDSTPMASQPSTLSAGQATAADFSLDPIVGGLSTPLADMAVMGGAMSPMGPNLSSPTAPDERTPENKASLSDVNFGFDLFSKEPIGQQQAGMGRSGTAGMESMYAGPTLPDNVATALGPTGSGSFGLNGISTSAAPAPSFDMPGSPAQPAGFGVSNAPGSIGGASGMRGDAFSADPSLGPDMRDYFGQRLMDTLLGEARNQGYTGMQSVANTVMNRANSNWGGLGVAPLDQLTAPNQFQGMNRAGPAYRDTSPAGRNAVDMAREIAGLAVSGSLPDVTGGARSFRVDNSPSAVHDNLERQGSVQIGDHVFSDFARPAPTPVDRPIEYASQPTELPELSTLGVPGQTSSIAPERSLWGELFGISPAMAQTPTAPAAPIDISRLPEIPNDLGIARNVLESISRGIRSATGTLEDVDSPFSANAARAASRPAGSFSFNEPLVQDTLSLTNPNAASLALGLTNAAASYPGVSTPNEITVSKPEDRISAAQTAGGSGSYLGNVGYGSPTAGSVYADVPLPEPRPADLESWPDDGPAPKGTIAQAIDSVRAGLPGWMGPSAGIQQGWAVDPLTRVNYDKETGARIFDPGMTARVGSTVARGMMGPFGIFDVGLEMLGLPNTYGMLKNTVPGQPDVQNMAYGSAGTGSAYGGFYGAPNSVAYGGAPSTLAALGTTTINPAYAGRTYQGAPDDLLSYGYGGTRHSYYG